MNRSSTALLLNISQVERDTGLSKDVLRMWERRYGFPQPARDANGERLYEGAQIDKLRAIKRLMDSGFRPGKLIDMSLKDLSALARQRGSGHVNMVTPTFQTFFIALIKAHDRPALEGQLRQLLLRQGVQEFVLRTVAPLTTAVGDAWMRGDIAIFEEHLYTELLQGVLRSSIQALPGRRKAPLILLTTLPDEQHGLGLLMVEALLAANGVPCVSLGTGTPPREIAVAAARHRVDVVALSFSAGFPLRQAESAIEVLRESLEPHAALWIGGALSARMKRLGSDIVRLPVLDEVVPSVAAWHAAHPGVQNEEDQPI